VPLIAVTIANGRLEWMDPDFGSLGV
jgi:hypothetical protein